MAQTSRPQAGDKTVTATYVDAGPYTADEWAELFRIVFTTDQQATQGVLRGVDNELAPTNPATRTVNVATGAGIVNGHLLINDAVVAIGVDAGAARNDALVMLENNSNAAIGAGAATNYNTEGNVSIPPYSARLAVVKDVAVNFSQTGTLWMTRLANFTTGAAALTGFTDVRDYCKFATSVGTRTVFVPAQGGRDATVPVADLEIDTGFHGFDMVDANDCTLVGNWQVPNDFLSSLTATVVIIPGATGNIRCAHYCDYGACGELFNAHGETVAAATIAVTIDERECLQEMSLASAAIGDLVTFNFLRYGTAASDTIGTSVYGLGWIVEYLASS